MLQPSLASAWSVPDTPPPEQMTHQTVRGQGVGTRARQPGICPHKTRIPTPEVGEGGMQTGTEATVCPADVHRQHPGVGEPVPDVWNLRAGAGAAVQRAGPGREPPVSVSQAGRRDSLGSPGALSELGVGAGGGGWPNSLSPSLAIALSGLQATVLQNCRLSLDREPCRSILLGVGMEQDWPLSWAKVPPARPLGGLGAWGKACPGTLWPVSPATCSQLQISPSPKCSMPNRTNA